MCGNCVTYEHLSPSAQAERRTQMVQRRAKAMTRVRVAKTIEEQILEKRGTIEVQQAAILASRKAWTQAEARKAPQALTDWLNDE